MKKYKAIWGYSTVIDEIEVVKETAKMVTYMSNDWGRQKERREAKEADRHKYFDTWGEAHAHIVQKQTERVDSIRLQLEREKGRLGQVKGMKPPVIGNIHDKEQP